MHSAVGRLSKLSSINTIYTGFVKTLQESKIVHTSQFGSLWGGQIISVSIFGRDQVFSDNISHMTDCHVEKALHMRNVKKICNVDLNIDVEHMKNKLLVKILVK